MPDFLIRIAIRLLLRQRLREIDAGSFADNHEAKMKWIEGVRQRDTIADLTHKANEQHYEVLSRMAMISSGGCNSPLLTQITYWNSGQDRVHFVDTRTLCKVFFVFIPYRKGDARPGGKTHVGELLCEGAIEGWARYPGPWMWCVTRRGSHCSTSVLTSPLIGWGSLSLFLAEVSGPSFPMSNEAQDLHRRNTRTRALLGSPIPRRRRRISMLRQRSEG